MTGAIFWMGLIGALNLWRGTGANQWSHTVKRIAIVTALCLPLAVALYPVWVPTAVVWVLALVIGFSMGWGAYFDLSDRPNRKEVAWIDWVIEKTLPPYEYKLHDYVGMTLRGLHFSVPPTVALALFGYPAALIMAPFGALMAPVYRWARTSRDLWTPVAEVVWGGMLAAIYFDMAMLTLA